MNRQISGGEGRAPREENRSLFEDLVRLLQVPHLSPEPLDLLQLVTARTGLLTGIDLCLDNPAAQRFRTDPELRRQGLAGSINRRVFGQPIQGHAHCTVTDFGRELLGHNHYLSHRR